MTEECRMITKAEYIELMTMKAKFADAKATLNKVRSMLHLYEDCERSGAKVCIEEINEFFERWEK